MSFDFLAFAKTIYAEFPVTEGGRPFILPALYGGNAAGKAAIILEEPSLEFTEKHWEECQDVPGAIARHRSVFIEWTKSNPKNQALFGGLTNLTRRVSNCENCEKSPDDKSHFSQFDTENEDLSAERVVVWTEPRGRFRRWAHR